MEILGFLILLGALVWLGTRISRATDRVDSLERIVFWLESELIRLKQRLDSLGEGAPGAGAPVKPAPAAPSVPPAPARREVPVQPAAAITPAAAPPAAPPMITVAPAPRPAIPRPQALPAAARQAPARQAPAINWEQFMGVKLFAWIGGFALFLAVALFLKWAYDNHLLTPRLLVALGFASGISLVASGVVLKHKAYEVTSQTLCATGVVVLYAAAFACRSYNLTGPLFTAALMALITVTAFLMAVRMNAMVVAILGLLGGFLTPPLLSTGEDHPWGLFGYIAILDLGLVALSLKRRWHFLVALAALGTVCMQIGWVDKFFAEPKVLIALAVFLGFDVLFLLAFAGAQRLKQANWWLAGAALALPFVTLAFALWLLKFQGLSERPAVLFSFLFWADVCLLLLVLLRAQLYPVHLVAGMSVFFILGVWTVARLTEGLLNWALGGYLVFAVLHTVFPAVLQRLRPGAAPLWLGHLFPSLALFLALLPMFKEMHLSLLFWPAVLLIDLAAIGLALLTASLLGIIAVLVLTVTVTAVWILNIPADLGGLPALLIVVGGFAVFFFLVGLFAGGKIVARLEAAQGAGAGRRPTDAPGAPSPTGGSWVVAAGGSRAVMRAQVPALSAILPFLLLMMAAVCLPLADPSPVYGLALLLVALLLGTTRFLGVDLLAPVSLLCVLALEYTWHGAHFSVEHAAVPLAWNVGLAAVFVVFPFLFRAAFATRLLPWLTAALSGPLHFYLVYRVVDQAYKNEFMGLLPAVFAVPMVIGLLLVARSFPPDQKMRNTLLALFAGSALFFITLIFPIQFQKQWWTLGWALEGVALLWLFHRVPHPGLQATGLGLLGTAFVLLALDPVVWETHPRCEVRILNWLLYTYGLATACLLAGPSLMAPPRHRVFGIPGRPILYSLGAVLGFLLLNLQIADYFSTGPTLTFQFQGGFGLDMAYSIGWALFALVMLSLGVWKRSAAVRYSGLALLGITLLKLFFHDLVRLSALYRVGAFLGVAVISILASVLYQRFFSATARGLATEADGAEQS
jgi:hypothetical protein